MSSHEQDSGRHNFFTCIRIKLFNSSLAALTWSPRTASQTGHQEKPCLMGYNSPPPKWVPRSLWGDEEINVKCHSVMIKVQEVIIMTAFTDILKWPEIHHPRESHTSPSTAGRYHSQTLSLCCGNGGILSQQAGQD